MKDFPVIRSVRAGLWGLAIMVLPLILLSLSPLTAPFAILLVVLALPMAACTAGLMCGALPMGAGFLSGVLSFYLIAGAKGAQAAALYLLPIMIAFAFVILRRIPFWKGCGVMIGAHVAALAAAYLLIQSYAGGQLYTLAGDQVEALLKGTERSDQVLYAFYQYGLITLPEELKGTALLPAGEGGYLLHPAARADLLLSMRTLVNQLMVTLVPTLIASQSILGGVGCLAFSLKYGAVAAQRRDFKSAIDESKELQTPDFPDLGMQPVSLWHIPRGIGWKVGACWVLGNLMQTAASPAVVMAGLILYAAAGALFTIQGIACVNFMQKAKGARKPWRVILPVVLYMLSALTLVGVFDQITNMRGLRKPPEPKEEE